MLADDTSAGRIVRSRRKAQLTFAVVATIAVLFWLAGHVLDVLLLGFAGILLGLFLSGIGGWLQEHTHVPRQVGTAIALLVLAGAATVFVWAAAPAISTQVDQIFRSLPEAFHRFTDGLARYSWGQALLERFGDTGSLFRRVDVFSQARGLFSSTFGVLGSAVLVLFVGLFVGFDASVYHEGLVRLIPPERRPRAREVLGATAHALRRWMAGKALSMAVIGVMTWIGLLWIGVPLAFTLALFAAILTFVPYFGPVFSAIPAVLLALLQGPGTTGWVVALYAAIQIVESYVITPLIQRKAVSLPPAVIILSQAILGALGGAVGIVVATPLAAAALVLVKSVYVEDVLGDRQSS